MTPAQVKIHWAEKRIRQMWFERNKFGGWRRSHIKADVQRIRKLRLEAKGIRI